MSYQVHGGWHPRAEQFDKLKIVKWGFVVVFDWTAALNVELHVVWVIGKREILHFKRVIYDLVAIAWHKSNVIFGIGAETVFYLSEELANGGIGRYLNFEEASSVLVDGDG